MTPPVSPSLLNEACERIAGWMHVTAGDADVITRAGDEWLVRSDVAALLAHCGWNVTVDDARVDDPGPAFQEDALEFGAES